MKAITVKQPYAHLIPDGIKDIENRTWRTNFRGRVFIHASAQALNYKHLSLIQIAFLHKHHKDLLEDIVKKRLVTSAIIGEVDIIDCVVNHPSIWAENTNVNTGFKIKPIYNWVLANPVLYDKPILSIKGKLSFWEPTPNQSCMSCNKEFFGHDPQYCCNGNMCGCIGQPIEPVVCSEKCYHELVNKQIEERKAQDLRDWERAESFLQNGGATKKIRKGKPTHLTQKKKKRKK